MKLKAWKKLFLPHILERGEDYYLNGAVEELDWDRETLTATVLGTDEYDVEIWISDGRVEDFYCSCPYAEDGTPCKHMAAVLFQFSEKDLTPTGRENKTADGDSGSALEALVHAMSATDAKALLLRLGREIGAVETQIRLQVTGKVPQKQQKDWLGQIKLLRRRYADRHGFIDYEHATDYTDALDDVMEEAVPMLLDAGMPAEAFQVVCTAFREASEAEMDDSDGGRSMLWDNCAEYWRTIIQAADAVQRGEMHAWFAANARDGALVDGADVIRGILFNEFPEETLLRQNLALLDHWIAEPPQDSYHSFFLESCLRNRLHTMELLSISPAEQEAWLRHFYQTPFARKHLMEKAEKAGDWEEALRILRESIQIDMDKPGLTDGYQRKIIEILRQQGCSEELRNELRGYVTERTQNSLSYVNELKDLTPPEEWEALREVLLDSPGMRSARGELMLVEGMYRRLLDDLIQTQNVWQMDRYAPELRKLFPAELLDFYLPRVEAAMRMASNRTRYAELCARLKTLRGYHGGKDRANEVADSWRTAYPRRKAMLEELKKAGF